MSSSEEETKGADELAPLVPFDQVPTYTQLEHRWKREKRGKAGYFQPKSRKRARMAKRVAVRNNRTAYRVPMMRASLLNLFPKHVKGAYIVRAPLARHPKTADVRARDELLLVNDESEEKGDAPDRVCTLPEIIEIESSDDDESEEGDVASAVRPTNVVHIAHTENPDGITVPDLGPVDWCGCTVRCHMDQCANASSSISCSSNTCRVGQQCGNRLIDSPDVQLKSGRRGHALFATTFIPSGTLVGEYAGFLTKAA